jgi:hypothetical protein
MFSNLFIDPKSICSTRVFSYAFCVWNDSRGKMRPYVGWLEWDPRCRGVNLSLLRFCNGFCRRPSAATFHTRHLSVRKEHLVFVAILTCKFDAYPIYYTRQKSLFLALWSLKMHYLTQRKYTVPTLQKFLVLWRGKKSLFILRRTRWQSVKYMGELFLKFKPIGT